MNAIPSQWRRGDGFSLVEVMVAMALGAFLTLGVIQVLSVSKGIYFSNAAIARMQDNGRFALEALARSIRLAGYTGCDRANLVNIQLSNPTYWWKNFATNAITTDPTGAPLPTPATFGAASQAIGATIMGYDGTQTHALPAAGSPAAAQFTTTSNGRRMPGSDALIVLGGDGGYAVTANDPGNFKLTLNSVTKPSGVTLKVGDLAIACDSASGTKPMIPATLFQVTGVGSGSIAYAGSLSVYTLTATDEVGRISLLDYIPAAFYIGTNDSCPLNSTCALPNALYQLQFSGGTMVAQQVVEGVQDMQILYGEDTNADGQVEQYSDATSVADWNNVLAVRISLLMVTLEDNIVPQPQDYQWPNDTGDAANFGRTNLGSSRPGDRHLYQVFSTTVGIRNRLRSSS